MACLLGAMVALVLGIARADAQTHSREDFVELCRTKAGMNVYETAENVEGLYVGMNVWGPGPFAWGLVKEGFRFIEVRVARPVGTVGKLYPEGPGYYRHTLEDLGHPKCEPFEKAFGPVAKQGGVDVHDVYGGKCMATWRIERPEAKYRALRWRRKWNPTEQDIADQKNRRWRARPGDIINRHTRYGSADGKKVYAEHNVFSFVSEADPSGKRSEPAQCPTVKATDFSPPSPARVFKAPPYTPAPPIEVNATTGNSMTVIAMGLVLPAPSADDFGLLVKVIPEKPLDEAAKCGTQKKFEALCRTKAGTRVYETATDVQGIFDGTSETRCWLCEDGLLRVGYRFVEFRASRSMTESSLAANYLEKPGLYRFTLEEANHPDCRLFYKRFEPLIKAGKQLSPRYRGKCIATNEIEQVIAKYKMDQQRVGNWKERKPGDLLALHTTYSNIDGSKFYAEHHFYKFLPLNAKRNFSTGAYMGKSCPERQAKDYPPPRVNVIFEPTQGLGPK